MAAGLLIAFPYRTNHGMVMVAVERAQLPDGENEAELLEPESEIAVFPGSELAEARREVLVLMVGFGSEAPATVRSALSEITELGAARDDVLLVASELVTNAVVHSGGSPSDTIEVRAVLTQEGVSISVQDPGPSRDSPRLRSGDALAAGGWGLSIVEQLAHRWGFERDRGHRVWAELRLPRAAIDLGPA